MVQDLVRKYDNIVLVKKKRKKRIIYYILALVIFSLLGGVALSQGLESVADIFYIIDSVLGMFLALEISAIYLSRLEKKNKIKSSELTEVEKKLVRDNAIKVRNIQTTANIIGVVIFIALIFMIFVYGGYAFSSSDLIPFVLLLVFFGLLISILSTILTRFLYRLYFGNNMELLMKYEVSYIPNLSQPGFSKWAPTDTILKAKTYKNTRFSNILFRLVLVVLALAIVYFV